MTYGPFRRREHTGAPADHFGKARHNDPSRWARVDHQGRITALVADGPDDPAPSSFAAIPVHHTGTTDASWDGPANEARLSNDDGKDVYREEFAWVDPDKDADTKAAYAFPHHVVDSDGKVGDANETACSSGIGVLNGGRGADSSATWWKDRKGIFSHLIAHLRDAGVSDEDLPELDDDAAAQRRIDALRVLDQAAEMGVLSAEEAAQVTGLRPGEYPPQFSRQRLERRTPVRDASELAERVAQVRERVRAWRESRPVANDVERTTVRLVDFGDAEMDMAVRWDDSVYDPLWRNPDGSHGRRGAFVSTTGADQFAMTAAAGPDVPQIVTDPGGAWHAYLCVEGVRTDEDPSRYILPGGSQFPDLPVSIRLLVRDEYGHYGAITCGRIDTMERQEVQGFQAIYGTGVFGTDENGQTGQLLVEEQTQRFVSIDPRDVDCEIIEVQVSTSGMWDDPDDCEGAYDWWVQYSSLVIGAATIVPTPALQQCTITMANVDLPEAPLATERAPVAGLPGIAASGAAPPLHPPRSWFEDPGFTADDPRLVRQPDGSLACPMTVTEDGRVYAHAAYWDAEHTGFTDRVVHPPHSPSYAYFHTGSVELDDGTDLAVGQLTMGCGHPSTSKDYRATAAHYDGGYGAVQMADVRAGEDQFGIWVAGALRPLKSAQNPEGPTPEQVRTFKSQGLSGDWRWLAGALHFVACLAVPVPGFPIAREDLALAASGAPEDFAKVVDLTAARYQRDAQRGVTALVAAGRVRRVPLEDQLAAVRRELTAMRPMYEAWQAERRAASAGALSSLVEPA